MEISPLISASKKRRETELLSGKFYHISTKPSIDDDSFCEVMSLEHLLHAGSEVFLLFSLLFLASIYAHPLI